MSHPDQHRIRRTELVRAPEGSPLVSSYPTKVGRGEERRASRYDERKPFGDLADSWAPARMWADLLAVHAEVIAKGGELSITELYRRWEVSASARRRYISGEKHAFVASPGGSMHNSSHACDLWVYMLNFPGPKDEWISTFWDIAQRNGLTPIIKFPDMGQSECWHYDWRDCWNAVYSWAKAIDRKKAYPHMARCAALDTGMWFGPERDDDQVLAAGFIQAQCHRLGVHQVGWVDFDWGPKTTAAVNEVLGYPDAPENWEHIAAELARFGGGIV